MNFEHDILVGAGIGIIMAVCVLGYSALVSRFGKKNKYTKHKDFINIKK